MKLHLAKWLAIFYLFNNTDLQAQSVLPEVKLLEQHLEEKVNLFLSGLDQNGFSNINITLKQSNITLPLTNLAISNYTVKNVDGSYGVKKIEIIIFSNSLQLDEKIKSIIADISGYSLNILELKVKALPANYTRIAVPAEVIQESPVKGPGYLLYGVAGIAAIFLLGLLITFFGFKNLSKTLRESIASLEGSNNDRLPSIQPEASFSKLPAASPDSYQGGGLDANYSDFPIHSFIALIADCYWSEDDAYASFIWKQIPMVIKQDLLDKIAFLQPYTAHLSEIKPIDRGLEQHPNYLKPVPLYHLDNNAVTQLVKEHPIVFHKLSPIRRENLSLPITELLKIANQDSSKVGSFDSVFKIIENIEHSQPRKLVALQILKPSSFDEELEIIQINPLSLDLVKKLPSIAWLTRLESDQVDQILEKFTAKELAQAWIAPAATLSSLIAFLPDGKAENLASYHQKISPSRDSVVFRSIYNFACEAIEQSFDGSPQDPPKDLEDAA